LRIQSATADFQDKVRKAFPLYELQPNAVTQQLPPELLRALGNPSGPATHAFKTSDGVSTISLSVEAMAVSTSKYVKWEQFAESLKLALSALVEAYEPAFFTRVGLRYQNLIMRSELGLQDTPWDELLEAHISGELGLPGWEENVLEFRHAVRCTLPSEGAFYLQHGIGFKEGSDEPGYIIDFDFYTDARVEVNDALATAEKFNRRTGSAFRSCIRETLHHKLEPSPV
jgi:uncharacterized protein (TIGR04255 family)